MSAERMSAERISAVRYAVDYHKDVGRLSGTIAPDWSASGRRADSPRLYVDDVRAVLEHMDGLEVEFAQGVLRIIGWPDQITEDPAVLIQRVQAYCLKILEPKAAKLPTNLPTR